MKFGNVLKILRDAVRQRAFPGAVLAIGHQQRLATMAAGRLTYEPDSPVVNVKTVYDLASLTKVVATTTAAMILVDRGLLRLEAPVAEYLPEFVPPYDLALDPLWAVRGDVTVRHLLAHTSGLPAYERFFLTAREKSHVLEQALQIPLEEPPGRRTLYSDIGFILLGAVIEEIAKQPLDELSRIEIFESLGMKNTRFNPPQDWRERVAPTEDDVNFRHRVLQGEVHDENAWVMGGVAGHAGLFGAAGDLATFCRMMLARGRSEDNQIAQPATIDEFTRAWPAEQGVPRALGWDKPSEPSSSGTRLSKASYGHLGFSGTSIWIDPEKSLFVILLTNRIHPSRNNDEIRKIRPALHDAVVESIGL